MQIVEIDSLAEKKWTEELVSERLASTLAGHSKKKAECAKGNDCGNIGAVCAGAPLLVIDWSYLTYLPCSGASAFRNPFASVLFLSLASG